tara:strand:- start:218 stop:490 length:273 start_codon:yes stop_codon:yes gene_type:complete
LNLSALCESIGVELLKNGETFKMAIPCQASKNYFGEGVETLRAAAKVFRTMLKRKSSPQTPQGGSENCSWEENLSLIEVAGSSPAVRTIY